MGGTVGMGLGLQAPVVSPMLHPYGVPSNGEVKGTGVVRPIGPLRWNLRWDTGKGNGGNVVQHRRMAEKRHGAELPFTSLPVRKHRGARRARHLEER